MSRPTPTRGERRAAPVGDAWSDLDRYAASSPDLYLLVDRDGHILYANHALAGADALAATGQVAHELVRAAALRVFESARAEPFEMGEMGPAGATSWWQCTASPVREGGEIVATLVHGTDITARKRLEERLRRSESLLVDAQGTAHLGTWEWDVTEPSATWSEELFRIYGLDPRTHVPTYPDYLTRVHPDDRQRVVDATDRVFHEHIPYSHDERVIRPDGTLRRLHTWAHPVLDPNGKLVKLVGVCQDVTDRVVAEEHARESDARVRALFRGAGAGMGFVGPDGRFLEVNPALGAMLGLTEDEARRITLDDLTHLEDRDRDLVGPALRAGNDSMVDERRLVRADGASFWARVVVSRVEGEAGPFGIVTVEDVTDRLRAEAADRVAASQLDKIQELERASEWKSRLLDIASHELKNPLTPINIQLHLLRTGRLGDLNERQARSVGLVARETDRLSKLVKELLDVARLQAGRIEIAPSTEDVARIVREVVESFRPTAADWGIALRERCEDDVMAPVDADRLKQVLFNLVGNALKFTPADGRVEVDARLEGDRVLIRVADTGRGIAREDHGLLFQPFSQVGDRSARERGTGLGLYICRAIVEAHGGDIAVDSDLGQGATFTVRLPAGPASR